MKLIAIVLIGLIGSVATAAAQYIPGPRLQIQPNLPRPLDQALRCPAKLATEVLPADVKPPWRPDSASMVLMSASIRQLGGQALLECAYKVEAASYAHAHLSAKAPPGACVVAPDRKSFLCARGTVFSH